MKLSAGARSSPLSRAQLEEIHAQLSIHHPQIEFAPIWASSPGDRDRCTSLRTLCKTDFFTRDLDRMLLAKEIRIAIHSAKDLSEPIPVGLSIVALTRGVDPRDSLVLRAGAAIDSLRPGARIAVSSERREAAIVRLRADLRCIDVRGTIGERLALLEKGEADGLVLAEAALIRLKMTHLNRMILPGESTPLQGRLAVLARSDDTEMKRIFQVIDAA